MNAKRWILACLGLLSGACISSTSHSLAVGSKTQFPADDEKLDGQPMRPVNSPNYRIEVQ